MTIFWLKRPRTCYSSTEETHESPVEPEYDEDGRRYVFRYEKAAPTYYRIDRDRLFAYMATHKLPGIRDRSIRRDLHNAGDFFEDVRELQTHSDVSVEARTQFHLRSVS